MLALAMFLCLSLSVSGQKEYVTAKNQVPAHPRILLLKGQEKGLLKQIKKDAIWKETHQSLIDEASAIIQLPVNERIKTGKRLLSISRENVRRIFILSYAYRMTGDKRYFLRAEAEMLKAASFVDWNPSHFLDVGEMTMALAIGYDWLYPQLSPSSRKTIETAIVEKGFKPSYDSRYNWFLTAEHNWNQVCNGGLTYGAIALWDVNPEMARKVINRAINQVQLPMKHYAPDGAYPEGVGYWEYGTSFNVMMISALETAFGTDFGLSKAPGFLATGKFVLNMVSPTLRNFNYSDNGARASMLTPLFWFSCKTKDPSILFYQSLLYKQNDKKNIVKDRIAPAMLIWGASTSIAFPTVPENLFYLAQGDNPVCSMRSGWESKDNFYVAVKAGSPSVNHAHQDVGSFVMEAGGIPWSIDLGGEEYNKEETHGIDLWNMDQNSQRWDVYRYNNFAHSTLSFNRKHQEVKGKGTIVGSSDNKDDMSVTMDLSPVYPQVKSVKRKVSLVDLQKVVVEDNILSSKFYTRMTWNMTTPAQATIVSDHEMMLTKDGKKLRMRVEGPSKVDWYIAPATPFNTCDSPNPDVSLVGFNYDLPLNGETNIRVEFSLVQ